MLIVPAAALLDVETLLATETLPSIPDAELLTPAAVMPEETVLIAPVVELLATETTF